MTHFGAWGLHVIVQVDDIVSGSIFITRQASFLLANVLCKVKDHNMGISLRQSRRDIQHPVGATIVHKYYLVSGNSCLSKRGSYFVYNISDSSLGSIEGNYYAV